MERGDLLGWTASVPVLVRLTVQDLCVVECVCIQAPSVQRGSRDAT